MCDQICRFLRIWSHFLIKSLMENFQFLCSICRVFTKNWSFLKLPCIFKEVEVKKNIFTQSWKKTFCRLFHVLAQFPFAIRESELNHYHQKVNLRVASRAEERLKTLDFRKLPNFKEISEIIELIANELNQSRKYYNLFPDKFIYLWLAFESHCFHGYA